MSTPRRLFVQPALARGGQPCAGSLRAPGLSQKPSLVALAARTGAIYERKCARSMRDRLQGLHERVRLDRFPRPSCAAGPVHPTSGLRHGGSDRGSDRRDGTRRHRRRHRRGHAANRPPPTHPVGDWRRGHCGRSRCPSAFAGILAWKQLLQPHRRRAAAATLPPRGPIWSPGGALMLTVGPSEGNGDRGVGDEELFSTRGLSPAGVPHDPWPSRRRGGEPSSRRNPACAGVRASRAQERGHGLSGDLASPNRVQGRRSVARMPLASSEPWQSVVRTPSL